MKWKSGEYGYSSLSDGFDDYVVADNAELLKNNEAPKQGAISRGHGEEPWLKWESGDSGDTSVRGSSVDADNAEWWKDKAISRGHGEEPWLKWKSGEYGYLSPSDGFDDYVVADNAELLKNNEAPKQGAISHGHGEEPWSKWESGEYGDNVGIA